MTITRHALLVLFLGVLLICKASAVAKCEVLVDGQPTASYNDYHHYYETVYEPSRSSYHIEFIVTLEPSDSGFHWLKMISGFNETNNGNAEFSSCRDVDGPTCSFNYTLLDIPLLDNAPAQRIHIINLKTYADGDECYFDISIAKEAEDIVIEADFELIDNSTYLLRTEIVGGYPNPITVDPVVRCDGNEIQVSKVLRNGGGFIIQTDNLRGKHECRVTASNNLTNQSKDITIPDLPEIEPEIVPETSTDKMSAKEPTADPNTPIYIAIIVVLAISVITAIVVAVVNYRLKRRQINAMEDAQPNTHNITVNNNKCETCSGDIRVEPRCAPRRTTGDCASVSSRSSSGIEEDGGTVDREESNISSVAHNPSPIAPVTVSDTMDSVAAAADRQADFTDDLTAFLDPASVSHPSDDLKFRTLSEFPPA